MCLVCANHVILYTWDNKILLSKFANKNWLWYIRHIFFLDKSEFLLPNSARNRYNFLVPQMRKFSQILLLRNNVSTNVVQNFFANSSWIFLHSKFFHYRRTFTEKNTIAYSSGRDYAKVWWWSLIDENNFQFFWFYKSYYLIRFFFFCIHYDVLKTKIIILAIL